MADKDRITLRETSGAMLNEDNNNNNDQLTDISWWSSVMPCVVASVADLLSG